MSFIVITGASSGLGYCFAEQLAAQGHDLIIIARREQRLWDLANKLSAAFPVKVEVVAADLAVDGVNTVVEAIQANHWPIAGLVNNAGFGAFGPFDQLDLTVQRELLQVNIMSVFELTYRLLPLLKIQASSFICNVSSVAAFQAGPYAALYFASKAFVLSFSEALSRELSASGISVSCLCPGPTSTEFFERASGRKKSYYDFMTMSAEDVVRISIKKLHKTIVIPGWRNKILRWASSVSPRWLTRHCSAWLNSRT